jgi:hypothetical protein
MKFTGETRSTRGKTCPSATSSNKNPIWTEPGSNPGLRGGRLAANRLSHGTAQTMRWICCSARSSCSLTGLHGSRVSHRQSCRCEYTWLRAPCNCIVTTAYSIVNNLACPSLLVLNAFHIVTIAMSIHMYIHHHKTAYTVLLQQWGQTESPGTVTSGGSIYELPNTVEYDALLKVKMSLCTP